MLPVSNKCATLSSFCEPLSPLLAKAYMNTAFLYAKMQYMATDIQKKETAKALYLRGIPTERILELTGVVRQTLSRWVNSEGWKELRAAHSITRDELTRKLMAVAGEAIDDPEKYTKNKKLADDLVKIMSAIEKLDKTTNAVHYVNAFINFENWLMANLDNYPDLPSDIVHRLHKAFDDFLTPLIQKKQ